MGIIDKIVRRKVAEVVAKPDPRSGSMLNLLPNETGVAINQHNSLQISAVWAAIRLLTETVGTLPVHLYRRRGNTREQVFDHPLARLIEKPNPEMPWNVFAETLQGHIETSGKAFAEIVYNRRSGYPTQIWPLPPDKVQIERNKDTGTVVYRYLPTGVVLPSYKVLHIIGFGYDGLDSYSPISLARQSIGFASVAEKVQARIYSKGTHLGGFVRHPGSLSDEAFDRLKTDFNNQYSGAENSGRWVILEEGTEVEPLKINLDDAQWLESRKFSVVEIARWFGIKPHMIADLEHATFSNIEHQSIEAVRYTFRPRIVRWEQALNNKLIMPNDGDLYFKFSLEGLLRGDIKSRYEAYRMGIQDGWLNANEVRAMEDLNPQPGEQGDTFFVPMNMAPKDQIIDGTYSTSSPPAISTEQPPESETVEYIEQSGSGQLTEAQYFGVQLREYRRSAYRGEIEAKVQDIVSKQISVIETALPVLSETGADAFYAQVRKAFEELEAETAEKFRPLFSGIAGDIIPDLQNEVRNAADISADVESFLDDYTSTFTKRINASNRGQIEKLVRDTPQSEVVSAITTRLGEWREKEAAKITSDEIVRVSDAVARTAYGALGVQYLRWVTRGSETCPYCQAMSGKIVGVSQPFISRGNEMVPEGKARGMRFSHDVRHAPLHQGCDCTIVASQ